MKSEGKTYVQCQRCGKITTLNGECNIEEIYIINYECPCCRSMIGLNLGNTKEDIYRYINSNVDYRYYEY